MQTRRSLPKGWLLATQKNSSGSVLSNHNECIKECPILQERDSVQEHRPEPWPNSSAVHTTSKLRKVSYSLVQGREKPAHICMIKISCPVSTDRKKIVPEWCKKLPVSKLHKAKKMDIAAQEFKGEIRSRKIAINFVGQQ